MRKLCGLVAVLTLALMFGGLLSGDEPKAVKIKGQLPANWKKLNLSPDQKQRIYSIQADYKKQIGDLQKQIVSLRKVQMSKMIAVLTKEQKTKLAEGLTDEPKDKKNTKDKE